MTRKPRRRPVVLVVKGALEGLDSIGITDPTTEEVWEVARRERPTLAPEACLGGLRRLGEAEELSGETTRWRLA